MAALKIVAEEWEDAATEFYYSNRHSGPIDYASGFEEGWTHAAQLLRGESTDPRKRGWS